MPIGTVYCHMDHFFTTIWAWRDLLKMRLKQIIKQDLAAQNSCWIMLSSFGSLIKLYSHYAHWKIHIITDCMHLLKQTRKTSEQNAFFAQEWCSVGGCQCVKSGQQWFDNNRFQSRNQWNLLLCFTSAKMGAAWHMLSLASSGTVPQCKDHASFLTLIFHKVV